MATTALPISTNLGTSAEGSAAIQVARLVDAVLRVIEDLAGDWRRLDERIDFATMCLSAWLLRSDAPIPLGGS